MACDLETTQSAACTSGIGKLDNRIQLLRIIAQLMCEISEGGGGSVGYDSYVALLNQTGTNAPVATVLNNDVGAIAWSRSIAGIYVGILAGGFPATKTWFAVLRNESAGNTLTPNITLARVNDNVMQIHTYDATNTLADDILVNHPIEIRVYP